ncbi:bacterio-opsin activator domain-containing protein [Natronoarchaeum mannanilyticum]|uniref:PAS domain S-box-containing protein n=1 Tax=Natronoarchaeum mannanilyticum TaxID=926360 RepID=A0AAV3TFF1_9EURY
MTSGEKLRRTLDAVERVGALGEPVTASEIADVIECTRRTAYDRLQRLAEDGELESKKIGARARVWWRSRQSIGDDGQTTGAPDLLDRKDQEQRLQHQRDELRRELDDVFERIDDAFYALDDELRFTYVNEQAEELLERSSEELIGTRVADAFPGTELTDQFRECLKSQEPTSFETYSGRLSFWLEANVYPSESGLSVYFRDITEQKRRERELEQYERIVETVDDGVYALDDDARFVLANEALCEMIGMDREELMGEHARIVFERDELAERAAEAASRVSSGERDVATMEYNLVTDDGDPVPVETRFRPLPFGDGEGRCGVVRDITDRKERERELQQQRDRLEALNELDAVALDITEAVVDQSTREEIERVVCESLASSDSYEFAWIAGVDPSTQSIEPHVEVGVDGYLDGVSISVDPEDPTGQGPAGRAVQTHEIQVVDDALEDPTFEPWRDVAREYGYRSAAAVPITHEGSTYGLLGVYADQPGAFGDEVRRVLHQLGEVIGHAIAAVERKRALLGNELVEVEFRIRDVFEALGIDGESNGRVTLDKTVPISDDRYLVYGTSIDGADESVERLVEALPHWEAVSFRGDERESFELTLDEPPVLTTVASLGGRVDEAVIEDGDYYMTIHLSPGVDVRQVIDTVREAYPNAEFVTRRQISRDDHATGGIRDVLTEELTDRQRAALEAALYAGFFEWPRENSGEEMAESLGIAAPTFHQHVRAAERKVFASLLGDTAPTDD